MTWLDFLAQNLIALIALVVSIASVIYTGRGISDRARAAAIRKGEGQMSKLEAEIKKLQEGFSRCIKERIGLKEEIQVLRRELERIRNAKTEAN